MMANATMNMLTPLMTHPIVPSGIAASVVDERIVEMVGWPDHPRLTIGGVVVLLGSRLAA
jgi:hypothetical protein